MGQKYNLVKKLVRKTISTISIKKKFKHIIKSRFDRYSQYGILIFLLIVDKISSSSTKSTPVVPNNYYSQEKIVSNEIIHVPRGGENSNSTVIGNSLTGTPSINLRRKSFTNLKANSLPKLEVKSLNKSKSNFFVEGFTPQLSSPARAKSQKLMPFGKPKTNSNKFHILRHQDSSSSQNIHKRLAERKGGSSGDDPKKDPNNNGDEDSDEFDYEAFMDKFFKISKARKKYELNYQKYSPEQRAFLETMKAENRKRVESEISKVLKKNKSKYNKRTIIRSDRLKGLRNCRNKLRKVIQLDVLQANLFKKDQNPKNLEEELVKSAISDLLDNSTEKMKQSIEKKSPKTFPPAMRTRPHDLNMVTKRDKISIAYYQAKLKVESHGSMCTLLKTKAYELDNKLLVVPDEKNTRVFMDYMYNLFETGTRKDGTYRKGDAEDGGFEAIHIYKEETGEWGCADKISRQYVTSWILSEKQMSDLKENGNVT